MIEYHEEELEKDWVDIWIGRFMNFLAAVGVFSAFLMICFWLGMGVSK